MAESLDEIKKEFETRFRTRIDGALEELLCSMHDIERAGGNAGDLIELLAIASNITNEKLLNSLKFEG